MNEIANEKLNNQIANAQEYPNISNAITTENKWTSQTQLILVPEPLTSLKNKQALQVN